MSTTIPLLRQAEAEVRALLLASAAVIELVPSNRIAVDEVAPNMPRPYIVFAKAEAAEFINSLSGAVITMRAAINLQCVAATSMDAAIVADACRTALLAAGVPINAAEPGHDPELGVDLESITFDWWVDP